MNRNNLPAVAGERVCFAFVKCSTSEAAQKLKTACDGGKVTIFESGGENRIWLLKADWSKRSSGRRLKPKSKQPTIKPVSEESI